MPDKACIIATILFLLSNTLRVVMVAQYHNRDGFSFSDWQNFDPVTLKNQWEWRMDNKALGMASGIMNAMAWFVFAVPILHVVWIQSQSSVQRGRRAQSQSQSQQWSLHVAVALLAIGGALTEFLSRLLYIGSTNAMEWMVNDFNLDNWLDDEAQDDYLGWKVLEVAHMAVQGTLLWIDAAEWLFLFFIFVLIFMSIRNNAKQDRLFSMQWAAFGLIMAFMCLFDFATEVLRFQSWMTFTAIALLITVINRLLLFPVWLLWLSRQLPKAEAALQAAANFPMESTASLTATDTALNNDKKAEEEHSLS